MDKKELHNSNFVIHTNATIGDVLLRITDNHRGCVVVVNDNFILEGVVSDGDIRRAMIRGATRMTPLSQIINRSPTIITQKEAKRGKGKQILKSKRPITLLPVVDAEHRLVDVVLREPGKNKSHGSDF